MAGLGGPSETDTETSLHTEPSAGDAGREAYGPYRLGGPAHPAVAGFRAWWLRHPLNNLWTKKPNLWRPYAAEQAGADPLEATKGGANVKLEDLAKPGPTLQEVLAEGEYELVELPSDEAWFGQPDPAVYAPGTNDLTKEQLAQEVAKGNVCTMRQLREHLATASEQDLELWAKVFAAQELKQEMVVDTPRGRISMWDLLSYVQANPELEALAERDINLAVPAEGLTREERLERLIELAPWRLCANERRMVLPDKVAAGLPWGLLAGGSWWSRRPSRWLKGLDGRRDFAYGLYAHEAAAEELLGPAWGGRAPGEVLSDRAFYREALGLAPSLGMTLLAVASRPLPLEELRESWQERVAQQLDRLGAAEATASSSSGSTSSGQPQPKMLLSTSSGSSAAFGAASESGSASEEASGSGSSSSSEAVAAAAYQAAAAKAAAPAAAAAAAAAVKAAAPAAQQQAASAAKQPSQPAQQQQPQQSSQQVLHTQPVQPPQQPAQQQQQQQPAPKQPPSQAQGPPPAPQQQQQQLVAAPAAAPPPPPPPPAAVPRPVPPHHAGLAELVSLFEPSLLAEHTELLDMRGTKLREGATIIFSAHPSGALMVQAVSPGLVKDQKSYLLGSVVDPRLTRAVMSMFMDPDLTLDAEFTAAAGTTLLAFANGHRTGQPQAHGGAWRAAPGSSLEDGRALLRRGRWQLPFVGQAPEQQPLVQGVRRAVVYEQITSAFEAALRAAAAVVAQDGEDPRDARVQRRVLFARRHAAEQALKQRLSQLGLDAAGLSLSEVTAGQQLPEDLLSLARPLAS